MGSYAKATMTGFICRLCSENKKCVIHFYSAKAQELELLKKFSLIPFKINKYDNLPKMICQQCIDKLNYQYAMMVRIKKSFEIQRRHKLFHNDGCPDECPLRDYMPNPINLAPIPLFDSSDSSDESDAADVDAVPQETADESDSADVDTVPQEVQQETEQNAE